MLKISIFDTSFKIINFRLQLHLPGVNELIIILPPEVKEPGPCLNIKTIFSKYGDSHVKDKTVGETVSSLTCESLYW